jgi:hypothetical protein
VSASTQSDNCAGVGAGSVVVGPVTQLGSLDGDIIPITRIGTAAKADKRCPEDFNPRTAITPPTRRNSANTTRSVSPPVVGNVQISVLSMIPLPPWGVISP